MLQKSVDRQTERQADKVITIVFSHLWWWGPINRSRFSTKYAKIDIYHYISRKSLYFWPEGLTISCWQDFRAKPWGCPWDQSFTGSVSFKKLIDNSCNATWCIWMQEHQKYASLLQIYQRSLTFMITFDSVPPSFGHVVCCPFHRLHRPGTCPKSGRIIQFSLFLASAVPERKTSLQVMLLTNESKCY